MKFSSKNILSLMFLLGVLGQTQLNAARVTPLRTFQPTARAQSIGSIDRQATATPINGDQFPAGQTVHPTNLDTISTRPSPRQEQQSEFDQRAVALKLEYPNLPDVQIAKRIGVKITTFRLALLRYRISHPELFDDAPLQESPVESVQTHFTAYLIRAFAHRNKGMSLKQFAATLGIDVDTIRRHTDHLGFNDDLAERLREHTTKPAIATRDQIIKAHVIKMALELGITQNAHHAEMLRVARAIGMGEKEFERVILTVELPEKPKINIPRLIDVRDDYLRPILAYFFYQQKRPFEELAEMLGISKLRMNALLDQINIPPHVFQQTAQLTRPPLVTPLDEYLEKHVRRVLSEYPRLSITNLASYFGMSVKSLEQYLRSLGLFRRKTHLGDLPPKYALRLKPQKSARKEN